MRLVKSLRRAEILGKIAVKNCEEKFRLTKSLRRTEILGKIAVKNVDDVHRNLMRFRI